MRIRRFHSVARVCALCLPLLGVGLMVVGPFSSVVWLQSLGVFAWALALFLWLLFRESWREAALRRRGRRVKCKYESLRHFTKDCPRCGYDLRGNLANGCPECGWNRAEVVARRESPRPRWNDASWGGA